jgi:hypothetical protein
MELHSMSEKSNTNLPFESSDPAEQQLWAALGQLPSEDPSANLRRSFYHRLEQAGEGSWNERLRDWLGLGSNFGWLTAAACVLLGFGLSSLVTNDNPDETARMLAMEQNITLLNRELVLGRLEDDLPGNRLQGVQDASFMVEGDGEIVQALLQRATNDRALSVRSAAIDALGSQLQSEAVGSELMQLLENSESPIVQLALVDLILRHGNTLQLNQLKSLADSNKLHPDLVRHVQKSFGGEVI